MMYVLKYKAVGPRRRAEKSAEKFGFFQGSNRRTRRLCFKSGWSNFCTLVGHFSKLFEFAGLSRLKIPIFVPKSGCSLKKKKKKVFTWNRSPKFLFRRKIIAFSKKITAAASDRQDLCKIDMRHAAREPVVGPRCYRRLPLLMIDKT